MSQSLLDDVIARISRLPDSHRDRVIQDALEATKNMVWVPNPGPQTMAYNSLADELYYGGQAGGGKDLACDTLLPTPNGWTTMGAVRKGDMLLDETGMPCPVVAVSKTFLHECYRLKFSDGTTVVCGAGHQWLTSNERERARLLTQSDDWRSRRRASRPSRVGGKRSEAFTRYISERNRLTAKTVVLPLRSVRTTEEIAATLQRNARGGLNHSIDVADSMQLPERELLVDPYVLGAWLGDGNSRQASITGIDAEIFQQVANAGYTILPRPSGPISPGIGGGLLVQLRMLGVLGNKHIPSAYLRASHTQRLALLQGLMDTDGTCDLDGTPVFSTTSQPIAKGVHEILVSLGIKCTVRKGVAKLYGRAISSKYTIMFLTNHPAFRISRKLILQKRAGFRGTHARRYIVAADRCESVPTRCVQVSSASRLYLCTEAMIPTHNSDLGIGTALTQHEQSLILRRFTADADSLAERALQILGSRDGFNGSPPVTIRLPGRLLTFGGMKDREDRQRYKGDPKDIMIWDEIPDFLEDQYTFVIGWNRSANPAQRSRVICTGNPPTQPEGLWVIKRWAAWLDPSHPKYGKVKDGDLLWYTTIDGKDTEVDGPGPHWIGGESIIAKSRTFIRAKLSDNPDLSATNYDAVLAAMPERERLAYREGRFDASLKDKTFQIIPSTWVRAAQDRWTDRPPIGVPMCAMFVDCTGGGNDPMAIASRHDGWYAPIHITPGHEIPSEFAGRFAAGIVVSQRRDNALMIIDMGGGYGGPLYEHLHMNFDGSNQDREPIVKPYKGSEASVRRTSDGTVGFSNKRTETLWKFREALDPGQAGGSPIMLAADDELFADLTAPSYKLERGLYHAEPKDKVCARLGRSTNKGDAVTGAWTAGPIASTDGAIWDQMRKEMGKSGRMGGRRPQVIMGRHNAKR